MAKKLQFTGSFQSSPGNDGKTAYQYAVEGGYTGSEDEFAAKLAAESLESALWVVNITEHEDGTYSADKTFYEIIEAYYSGKYYVVAVWYSLTYVLSCANESAFCAFTQAYSDSGNWIEAFDIYPDNTVEYFRTEVAAKVEIPAVDDTLTKSGQAADAAVVGERLDTLSEEMPDKLPNPNALTFTGAVEGSYDGSAPLEVEIPSGGDPGQWEYIGEFMESDQPTFESGKYRFFYAETFFTSDTSSAIVYRYPCIDGYHYCRWAFPSVKNRTARILIAHGLCALLFTEDGTTYPSSTARGAANMHPAGGEDASVGTAFWATSGADYPISTFGIKLWGAK